MSDSTVSNTKELDLIDDFVIAVISGLINREPRDVDPESLAKRAYIFAGALLNAREALHVALEKEKDYPQLDKATDELRTRIEE